MLHCNSLLIQHKESETTREKMNTEYSSNTFFTLNQFNESLLIIRSVGLFQRTSTQHSEFSLFVEHDALAGKFLLTSRLLNFTVKMLRAFFQ